MSPSDKRLNAEALAKQASLFMAKNGEHRYGIHVLPKRSDQSFYRVRIGPIQDRALAEKLQKQLLAIHDQSSLILKTVDF